MVTNGNIVQKIWNLCNVLRGDGISYREYISELTYLLFLKIAEETNTEDLLSDGYRWKDLLNFKSENLLGFYQEMLTHLGAEAKSNLVRQIYAFPTTVFSHSENLRVVVDGIAKLDWHSINEDAIGNIYEGLLSKNSEDARSGAGQYFTPRALVDCIIEVIKPSIGEIIQDPAIGTGGFLISADQYIKKNFSKLEYKEKNPFYQGMEIERGTFRLCLMNTFLHNMSAEITLGDALTIDAKDLMPADLIIANPPFGSKSGSVRKVREDISYPTSNKQLEFLQHIYMGLKPGGRAAVVLPDNVLFEDGVGKKIRNDLMEKCNVHTILRLPTGIFYSPGVKTNVLFFSRGKAEFNNTKNTWIYDMRADMPQFGKRSPLTKEHFKEFIHFYGDDPNGNSDRSKSEGSIRVKNFSREEVNQNNGILYLNWIKEEVDLGEVVIEPQELLGTMIIELENTIADLKNMMEFLSEE